MKIALILILSVFLASCVTQQKCNTKFPPAALKDSIYIEKVKEVAVLVPGDTIKVDVPINCPDQDVYVVENVKLRQQVRILNGRLVSNTQIKPDTIRVHTVQTKTITKEVKVSVPEKYIPNLYKIALFLWIGVIITIVGYVLLRLFVFKK